MGTTWPRAGRCVCAEACPDMDSGCGGESDPIRSRSGRLPARQGVRSWRARVALRGMCKSCLLPAGRAGARWPPGIAATSCSPSAWRRRASRRRSTLPTLGAGSSPAARVCESGAGIGSCVGGTLARSVEGSAVHGPPPFGAVDHCRSSGRRVSLPGRGPHSTTRSTALQTRKASTSWAPPNSGRARIQGQLNQVRLRSTKLGLCSSGPGRFRPIRC